MVIYAVYPLKAPDAVSVVHDQIALVQILKAGYAALFVALAAAVLLFALLCFFCRAYDAKPARRELKAA